MNGELRRCFWANPNNPLYLVYHDEEWGNLQLPGQFQQYAVYQLVVCQLVRRINPDAAEDLIMDVPIQSLHQLRSGQACVHFQKC